jgi:hypothetical protein
MDLVVVEKGTGRDVVYDFNPKYDTLDLSAFGLKGALAALFMTQSKNGVTIHLGGGDSIELLGVKRKDLSNDDFIFDHDGSGWFV